MHCTDPSPDTATRPAPKRCLYCAIWALRAREETGKCPRDRQTKLLNVIWYNDDVSTSGECEIDRVQVKSVHERKPKQANNANHGQSSQDHLCIRLERPKILPLVTPGAQLSGVMGARNLCVNSNVSVMMQEHAMLRCATAFCTFKVGLAKS